MSERLPFQYCCKGCGWTGFLGYDRTCPECGGKGQNYVIRVNYAMVMYDGKAINLDEVRLAIEQGAISKGEMLEIVNAYQSLAEWVEWRDDVLSQRFLDVGIQPNGILMQPAIGYTRLAHEIREARREGNGVPEYQAQGQEPEAVESVPAGEVL